MNGFVLENLTPNILYELVAHWSLTIGVTVSRVQIRKMRTKWGSISTAGNLTLSSDLLYLPGELVEYVIVHELVHLRCPHHGKTWKVNMSLYLPDWRKREKYLQKFIAASSAN